MIIKVKLHWSILSVTLEEFDHRPVYEFWSIVTHHKVTVSEVGHVQHLDVVTFVLPDECPEEVPGVREIAQVILAAMGEEQGDIGGNIRKIVEWGARLIVVPHVLLLIAVVVPSNSLVSDHW